MTSHACLALALLALAPRALATPQNVLWLPLGDSITHGCTGPTIQDCHATCAGYRIPLALALSQPPLGAPTLEGFNVTTMGTATTGPSYVPAQWLRHCGFPGWTIPMINSFLPKALASSPARPDLVTIHLGTNDCGQGHPLAQMTADMNTLLNSTFQASPASHVFLADTIATGMPFNTCIVCVPCPRATGRGAGAPPPRTQVGPHARASSPPRPPTRSAWNAAVPGLVAAWAARGMKITFVPMYAEVRLCGDAGEDADLCGGHQVHPTSAGYPRMASAFALQIMKYFERTQ